MPQATQATGAKAEPHGGRSRPRLALEITIALLVKLLLLYVIWVVWFAHPASTHLDERGVTATLFGVAVPRGREESRE